MFCANCGKQLADEVRFCTSCGVPVERAESFGELADGVGAGAAGAAKPANFKAAMDSTKARGKRRMPVIVLVALALALTSAIAFAAHYVYTEHIAPMLAERQSEDSLSVSEGGKVWVVDAITTSNSTKVFNYDEEGVLAQVVVTHKGGLFDGDVDYMNFAYQNGLLTEVELDKGGGNQEISYIYDDEGRCIEERWVYLGSTVIGEKVVHSYADGLLVSSAVYGYGSVAKDAEEAEQSVELGDPSYISYGYEDGMLSSISMEDPLAYDDILLWSYERDADGRLRGESEISSYGSEDLAFSYDDHGNLIGITDAYGNETVITYKEIDVVDGGYAHSVYTHPTPCTLAVSGWLYSAQISSGDSPGAPLVAALVME